MKLDRIPRYPNDAVHRYMNELTSRIVAQTGKPSDRFHLGKIILQSLKDAPEFVLQIDGATGDSMTFGEALEKTIRCATAFRKIGLKHGDVMVLMSSNRLDLTIPYYAALYEGIIIATIDMTLGIAELQDTFAIEKPKIVFCLDDRAADVQKALRGANIERNLISFDNGKYGDIETFLEKYGEDIAIEDYKAQDFDSENSIAFLVATSGTTGLPKAAALTHKNLAMSQPYTWSRFTTFPTPTSLIMITSAPQWVTAIMMYLGSAIMKITRLQSSRVATQEHSYYLINKYRPTFSIMSPTLMALWLRPEDRDQCDFTSFEVVLLGGSAVQPELVEEAHRITPKTEIINVFGMSELSGVAFHGEYLCSGPGKPLGSFQYRLVDVETAEDILEPNVRGELWIKGDGIFKGYYNNPKATEETFAEDGWFKTGDLFYRDENWTYYFVERIKLLLKYRNHQISPVELETVIKKHPNILEAVVVGLEDPDCGELPVACVVKAPNCDVSAQEIKDLVKGSLTDSKQLRGGVLFLNELPMAASTKINRRKLKELAFIMPRE